jgi:hypothetical protein
MREYLLYLLDQPSLTKDGHHSKSEMNVNALLCVFLWCFSLHELCAPMKHSVCLSWAECGVSWFHLLPHYRFGCCVGGRSIPGVGMDTDSVFFSVKVGGCCTFYHLTCRARTYPHTSLTAIGEAWRIAKALSRAAKGTICTRVEGNRNQRSRRVQVFRQYSRSQRARTPVCVTFNPMSPSACENDVLPTGLAAYLLVANQPYTICLRSHQHRICI